MAISVIGNYKVFVKSKGKYQSVELLALVFTCGSPASFGK